MAVPGTTWDTSRLIDQSAIEQYIMEHRMTQGDLGTLVASLELAHRGPFEEKLLKFARYELASRRDINDVYNRASAGGVWTKASVLFDGTEVLETTPVKAAYNLTGAYARDALGAHEAEIDASEHDSEVGTLDHLMDFFGTADLSSVANVNLILSGSMGPCNGCKARIAKFILDVQRLAQTVRASFRLIVDLNYSTASHTKNRLPTTRYGFEDEDTERVLPDSADEYEYYKKRFIRDVS